MINNQNSLIKQSIIDSLTRMSEDIETIQKQLAKIKEATKDIAEFIEKNKIE